MTCKEVVPGKKIRNATYFLGMVKKGKGTILFTGATASTRALAGLSSFSVGKFGLRALAQSLASELGPKGIHVIHVIVDGAVDVPIVRNFVAKNHPQNLPTFDWMDPTDIAEQYWLLHSQPKSTWTQEIDLRPFSEKIGAKL